MPQAPHRSNHILIILAALIVIFAGLKTAQALIVPFLLAFFISIICAGPFFWLQKRKVPATVAMLIVIFVVMLGGMGVLTLVGTSVTDFTNQLPSYQDKLRLQTLELFNWLESFGIHLSKNIILEHFDPGAIMQSAASMLATAGGVLTNSFLILLTVIFILLEAAGIPGKIRAALPHAEESLETFDLFVDSVRQYLAIKTLVSAVTGAIIALALTILGLDYALLWGVIAFLLNYVPNIGSIIAAVPAILLAIIQLGIFPSLMIALLYIVVNLIMGSAVEPRLMGQKLGLSALVVFVSLVFWGWILGPVGMLLSVPLTMIVKIALEVNESTRWLAILLGSDVPSSPDA